MTDQSDIEKVILQLLYDGWFRNETRVNLRDLADEHGWDHLTYDKAVAKLVDVGLIRAWGIGPNYRIQPAGIVYAEEQGIPSETQIEACRDLRTRLLVILRELYDKEGRSAAKHFETLATETGSDLDLVLHNIDLLEDRGYLESPASGTFKLSRSAIDGVDQPQAHLIRLLSAPQREHESMPQSSQPNVPPEIQRSLQRFREDYPNPSKVAFIMMRFGETDAHQAIVQAIREALEPFGIAARRADEKEYHDTLLSNVLTYIHGCAFGIAVFERIEEESFNPNVALEVGYMMAMDKPVCLLKDRTLKTLHVDLIGKLYKAFDPYNPSKDIKPALAQWLDDKDLLAEPAKPLRRTTGSLTLWYVQFK